MAEKIDAKVYREMSAKELFVVFQAASARQDFGESDRILAAAPKSGYVGIDREVARLAQRAMDLASLFLFDLQEALGRYRALRLAADALCVDRGLIPFGIGEDEEAVAQAMQRAAKLGDDPEGLVRDLPIARLRVEQDEQAQKVGAIVHAIQRVCDEEVGLTPEQLIGSTAPYGLEAFEAAAGVQDLDPEPNVVETYLERYRMLWRGRAVTEA